MAKEIKAIKAKKKKVDIDSDSGLNPSMPTSNAKVIALFTSRLLQWHRELNRRQMPWKGEKDPYKIWLSEIILQQTRVEQGLAYYEKFIRHYPRIQDLAAADPDQVFKDWEGLGYYSRCKNLLHTAKVITHDYQGIFPSQYEQILALKGIGPYTAAAISAFAFNQPYAVLDGNVFRVLARFFGIDTPIDSANGKLQFQGLAEKTLSKTEPAAYNQAIMDFGATVCKPAQPLCGSCVMQDSCVAKRTARVMTLPKKEKTLQKKTRHITWLILELPAQNKNSANTLFYVQKRPAGDIWENLHEFYPVESPASPDWTIDSIQELIENQLDIKLSSKDIQRLPCSAQQLTHQKIHGYFYRVKLTKKPPLLASHNWHSLQQMDQLAFPKLLKILQTNLLEKQ